MIVNLENVNQKLAIIISLIIWISAFIVATIIMIAMDVDFEEWGTDSPDYWEFELYMNSIFIVFAIAILSIYFRRSGIDPSEWKSESITAGLIIMVIQFILDTIVLVLLMGSGPEYYLGFVTITYLTIPGWMLLVGWYWRVYTTPSLEPK